MSLCCMNGPRNGNRWLAGGMLAAAAIMGTAVLLTDNNGDGNSAAAAFIVLLGGYAAVRRSRGRTGSACCSDGLVDCTLGDSEPDDADEIRDVFEDRRA